MLNSIFHILRGFNSGNQFVIAVSGEQIVFVNTAAQSVADEDYVGRTVSEMLGEELAAKSEIIPDGSALTVEGALFFDHVCTAEIISGEPTLYIFTPSEENDNETLNVLAAYATGLKSPLTELFQASEGLRKIAASSPDDRLKRYASLVDHSGYRMLQMLNRVTTTRNNTPSEAVMRERTVNLTELCGRITSNASEAAQSLGVEIVFDEQSSAAITVADSEKIELALLSLLSNALKSTPSGGKVTVGVYAVSKSFAIRVSDSGSGLPPEKQARLGEIVRSERPAVGQGTGLGLRLVREVAALHGGSMMVESQQGIGTTVTFSVVKKQGAIVLSDSGFVVYEAARPYLEEFSVLLRSADFAELRSKANSGSFPSKPGKLGKTAK